MRQCHTHLWKGTGEDLLTVLGGSGIQLFRFLHQRADPVGALAAGVAAGLALTIFGVGLSSFVGSGYVGQAIDGFDKIAIPLLSDIPVLGTVLFTQDALVYASLVIFVLVYCFLRYSRSGLILRAVGESPEAANANGLKVLKVRYLAVAFGGAMAGLAGAYLSLAYTPMWTENMTAGRGWIGITPRGAYETMSVSQMALLPPWLVLLLVSGLILAGWLREGRR